MLFERGLRSDPSSEPMLIAIVNGNMELLNYFFDRSMVNTNKSKCLYHAPIHGRSLMAKGAQRATWYDGFRQDCGFGNRMLY